MEMSDVLTIPLSNKEELIIASDNSAAIGEKEEDAVHVENEVAGYYTCRVAYMDFLRAGGVPKAIVLQNFTGDTAWHPYKRGIRKLLTETTTPSIPITGSTESNFTTVQSGLGLTIIGVRDKYKRKQRQLNGLESFAVIGKPLVGDDTLEQAEHIAPMKLYEQLAKMDDIIDFTPVGSTGIEAEWQKLTRRKKAITSALNVKQSGGPSTCFIIAYEKRHEDRVKQVTDSFFYPIYIK